jgi:hypothetical protein
MLQILALGATYNPGGRPKPDRVGGHPNLLNPGGHQLPNKVLPAQARDRGDVGAAPARPADRVKA